MCLTGFSPQIALPTFQGAQARGQSDSESPIITITASDGSNAVANNSITNDATLSLTFTANENIAGFAIGDIGSIGGSLSSFSGSNATYTATFTPSSNRNTVVYIPKEVYTDASSNNNINSIPTEFALGQNYPNPFNPVTKMDISLPITGDVSLVIYNILGQKVRTLFSGDLNYGYHTMQLNGLDDQGLRVSSGVYFSEFRSRDHRKTKKMLLLK